MKKGLKKKKFKRKNYKSFAQSIGILLGIIFAICFAFDDLDLFIYMGAVFGWVIGVLVDMIMKNKVKYCSIQDICFLIATIIGILIVHKVSIYFMISGLIIGDLISSHCKKSK